MRVFTKNWNGSNCLTAFFCLILFAGTIASINFESVASDDPRLSVEVLSSPLEFPDRPESAVIADRILTVQSDTLLFDIEKRNILISEIEQVLKLVRETHPATAEILATESHQPATISVGLTSELLESVWEAIGDGNRYIKLHTGNEEFDALNSRLGVHAILPYKLFDSVYLYIKFPVNLLQAQIEYAMIAGVENVGLDSRLGDYSDIGMVKFDNEWFVAFRKAWGDCPSGCLYEELMFFRVREGEAKQIKEKVWMDAMN